MLPPCPPLPPLPTSLHHNGLSLPAVVGNSWKSAHSESHPPRVRVTLSPRLVAAIDSLVAAINLMTSWPFVQPRPSRPKFALCVETFIAKLSLSLQFLENVSSRWKRWSDSYLATLPDTGASWSAINQFHRFIFWNVPNFLGFFWQFVTPLFTSVKFSP